MQTVHRATTLADAAAARDVLVASGIPSHISNESLWVTGSSPGTELIRVMVDNRSLDSARRAIAAWKERER